MAPAFLFHLKRALLPPLSPGPGLVGSVAADVDRKLVRRPEKSRPGFRSKLASRDHSPDQPWPDLKIFFQRRSGECPLASYFGRLKSYAFQVTATIQTRAFEVSMMAPSSRRHVLIDNVIQMKGFLFLLCVSSQIPESRISANLSQHVSTE